MQTDYLPVAASQKSGHSFTEGSAVKLLARSGFSSGGLPQGGFMWCLAGLFLVACWTEGLSLAVATGLRLHGPFYRPIKMVACVIREV